MEIQETKTAVNATEDPMEVEFDAYCSEIAGDTRQVEHDKVNQWNLRIVEKIYWENKEKLQAESQVSVKSIK